MRIGLDSWIPGGNVMYARSPDEYATQSPFDGLDCATCAPYSMGELGQTLNPEGTFIITSIASSLLGFGLTYLGYTLKDKTVSNSLKISGVVIGSIGAIGLANIAAFGFAGAAFGYRR